MADDRMHSDLTRREFAGLVSAAAALPLVGASQATPAAQPDYVLPQRPLLPDAPRASNHSRCLE